MHVDRIRIGPRGFVLILGAALVASALGGAPDGRATSPRASDLGVAISGGPTSGPLPLTVSLMASASGGIAPYNYTWSVDGGPTVSYGPTFTFQFPTAGTFNVTVSVVDVYGEPGQASESIRVLPALLSVGLSATPSSVAEGNATYLVANASGGYPPYTYAWSGLPTGCLGGNFASIRCVPEETGGYTVTVNVTDASGATTSQIVGLVVTVGSASGPPVTTPSSGGSGIPLWELATLLTATALVGAGVGLLVRPRLRRGR